MVSTQANKLRNGLWKIDDTKAKVTTMSEELEEAQIKVLDFQQQCDDYLVIIVAQKKEADEQQVTIFWSFGVNTYMFVRRKK